MDTKTTLPISDARKKIFDIAKKVQDSNIIFTLTDKGYPKAVIMSAQEFESWIETLEVLDEFPDLKKEIKKVKSDVKSGKYKKYKTLDEIMNKK